MSARNSAKAIVLSRGKILVNRCVSRFGEYYALPGGGQRTGEMLTETETAQPADPGAAA